MSGDSNKDIGGYSADYRSVHAQEKKKPKPEPRKAAPPPEPEERLPAETEVDDFLPEGESGQGEQLLSKWDDGLGPEPGPFDEKPKARRRGKHGYGIFVGTVVLLLALCGVGFLAAAVGGKIHAALTDDSKLRAYDRMLTIVVAQDPAPFASPEKADPDFVLNASLWKALAANGTNYTSYDDAGWTLVPLGDVASACRELFGPDCRLQPQNPASESFFKYDSAKAQFHVSLYSLDSTYVPYSEYAKKEGDATVVHVGYVPPSDRTRAQSGVAVSSGAVPKPTKYMDYVLKTDPSTQKQYIYAVRKSDG